MRAWSSFHSRQRSISKTVRTAGSWTIRVLAVGWLLFHLTLTAVYVMPDNPVKENLRPLLITTIDTYFAQNWSLFAPNPISRNEVMLVRCLNTSESSTKASKLPIEGWHDISTPLWHRSHEHRFSAYSRIERPLANGINGYLYSFSFGDLTTLHIQCMKGDRAACAHESQSLRSRADSSQLIRRIASSFCNAMGDASYTKVAVRLREALPISWDNRYLTVQPQTHDYELGVYETDTTMTAATFYKQDR